MNITGLSTLCASVFLFICFLFFSCFNYKNKFRSSYDFRNHFPYEMNYDLHFKDNFFGNTFLVLSLLASIFFFVFFNNDHSNGLLIFSLVSGVIVAFDIALIIFTPLKFLRTHLGADVILFTFAFMLPCAVGATGILNYSKTSSVNTLVIGILGIIVALFLFVLIMNPKLNKWAKMDSITSEDGTISYVRPHYFILAFTEWVLIFSYFVSQILLFLLVTL